MDKREVTEFDLRAPEFKHPETKLTDLEFRTDGKIVRKDRYERGFRSLVEPSGFSLRGFEIDDVVEKIESTFAALNKVSFVYLETVLENAGLALKADGGNKQLLKDIEDALNILASVKDVLEQPPEE